MNSLMQQISVAALGMVAVDDFGTLKRQYCFAENFLGFSGHFPGHPILPAIVEIMIVVSLISDHARTAQSLLSVESAKFLNPVGPNQEITVRCRPCTLKGKLIYDAQLTIGDTISASMQVELTPLGAMP